jgi:hypothetical protein
MNLVDFWRYLAEVPMEDAIDQIKSEIDDQTHDLTDEEYSEVLSQIIDHCHMLQDAKDAERKLKR